MIRLTKIGFDIFYNTNIPEEKEYLETCLSYYDDNSRFSKNEYWDGYVRYFDKRKKCFNFGHLSYIISKLESKSIQYNISGIDIDIFQPKIKYKDTMLPHQIAALYSFWQTKFGIIKVPTRGGKTYLASEGIRMVNNSNSDNITLFLVDTVKLFKQAIKNISEHLGIPSSEIGYIRDGKFNLKKINVITIQTIESIYFGQKRIRKTKKSGVSQVVKSKIELREEKKLKVQNKNRLIDFLKTVNFLIVDECHCYSSQARITILKECTGTEFNMFISATPFKSEDKFANLNIRGIAGDILYEIPEKTLKDNGHLADDKVILIRINHDNDKNINESEFVNYFDAVDKLITNNKERNQIAVNVIEICRKLFLKTLVLFFFKSHGKKMSRITSDYFISGDDNDKYIDEITEDFLNEKGGVLFASNIFNKGVTLPQVEILMNISGGKEQADVIQKKGRVLGVTKDKKKALIIDFIDENSYFIEHSLSRLEVYETSVGKENVMVFDPKDEDFYPELREFIKQWFNEGL